MAKKRKKQKSQQNDYKVQIIGLIIITLSIIGVGFGPLGTWIKKGFMFLFGELWVLFPIILLILGFYLLIKGKLPKFITPRMIGIYLLIIVALSLFHMPVLEEAVEPSKVFTVTNANYVKRMQTIVSANITSIGLTNIHIGGGIIGAAVVTAFASMFAKVGTYIVLAVVALVGIILLFDFSLTDALNDIIDKYRKEKVEDEDYEDDVSLVSINREQKIKEKELELTRRLEKLGLDDEDKKPINNDATRPITTIQNLDEIKNIVHDGNAPKPNANLITMPEVARPQANINPNYKLPPMTLLGDPDKSKKVNSSNFLISKKTQLEAVLQDFQINGKVVDIHMGPAVTQFEVAVPNGTRVSRISSINKEIALALEAKDVRIQAPIPGKSTIGVEIPNQSVASVKIKEILGDPEMVNAKGGVKVALGRDLMGNVRYADITKMPHLLIAGSTGSGKSVCTNSIIISILMRYRPDEVKLVLVDPKQVELSDYNGVPHLLCPVVTNPKKASATLQKIVVEMDRRYHAFADNHVRKIDDYNKLVEEKKQNGDDSLPHMPYIIVIIDEMADLMVAARKEVEDSIMRITQLARAAGIHLITATQRPSTDVITGVVKSNIPSRIAFAVASQIDSRTILDHAGAEKLLGKGDMLFLPMGQNDPDRVQGCFVSDDEIRKIIEATTSQQQAVYDDTFDIPDTDTASSSSSDGGDDDYDDPMYNEVVEFAVQSGKISASLIQRRFRFGYNRAARIIDLLEQRGIVGPQNGSKPREVLVKLEGSQESTTEE